MKKYTLLLLCIVMATLCSSCAKSASNVSVETSVSELDLTVSQQPESSSITSGEIYRSDDLVITTDSIDSDSMNTYLVLNIENISDQNVYLTCESACLNGFVTDAALDIQVDAGKTVLAGLTFNNPDLNICDIKTVASILFKLTANTVDDFTELYTTDWIEIKTDQYDTYTQSINTEGTVLYDKNNIQLIAKGTALDADNTPAIVIMIVNNSDTDIYLSAEVGEEKADTCEATFGYEIPAKASAIKNLYFYSEEGDIVTTIYDIPVIFSITSETSWKEIARTGNITFDTALAREYEANFESEEAETSDDVADGDGSDDGNVQYDSDAEGEDDDGEEKLNYEDYEQYQLDE